MKNISKILLVFSAFLITSCTGGGTMSTTEIKKDHVNVIVISGQSNAVGCSHSSCITRSINASKYHEYMEGYPNIQIAFDNYDKLYDRNPPIFYSQNHSKNNNFVKVMLGQGNSEATFGPEIGIAEALHEKYGDKLFIIKLACGASNLRDDWTDKDSPMYPHLISYIKLQMENLEKLGYQAKIKAFCWMQGEGDSYPSYHDVYYENTKKFVANIRNDLKSYSTNEIAFIDAGISNAKKDEKHYQWEFWKEVNNAKIQFANESDNNFYIDTIEAGMHTNEEPFGEPDFAHYDSPSEVLLGRLFAEKIEQFLD